jgi:hypothetical protein
MPPRHRPTAPTRSPTLAECCQAALAAAATLETKPLSTLASLRERYAGDFVAFASLLKVHNALPGEAAGKPVPLVLTPVQIKFNEARTGRDIVLKARKMFISTVELARDVWCFLVKPGASVRVVCQTEADGGQRKDFAKALALMLDSLREQGLDVKFPGSASVRGRWVLPVEHGAGVLEVMEAGATEQTADKKGRGGTTTRLHCTEIAFWENASATMGGILETVVMPAPHTEITVESTPSGVSTSENDPRGGAYFHRMWQRATAPDGDEFEGHFFPWYDVPPAGPRRDGDP